MFASPDIVTLKKLREILGDFLDARLVSDALIAANDSLNKINSPFEIVEQAGGYRFRTRAKYYPWVRKLFPEANARRLSQAALETLAALFVYRKPPARRVVPKSLRLYILVESRNPLIKFVTRSDHLQKFFTEKNGLK